MRGAAALSIGECWGMLDAGSFGRLVSDCLSVLVISVLYYSIRKLERKWGVEWLESVHRLIWLRRGIEEET